MIKITGSLVTNESIVMVSKLMELHFRLVIKMGRLICSLFQSLCLRDFGDIL